MVQSCAQTTWGWGLGMRLAMDETEAIVPGTCVEQGQCTKILFASLTWNWKWKKNIPITGAVFLPSLTRSKQSLLLCSTQQWLCTGLPVITCFKNATFNYPLPCLLKSTFKTTKCYAQLHIKLAYCPATTWHVWKKMTFNN